MIKRIILFQAIFIAALTMGGCGGDRDDRRPARNDARSAYDLAFRKYQKGYYNEAVAMYKRALDLDPDLSRAHFDLGLIYDDYLPDKDRAIYHYSMYLKLEPDTEKADMVREWIEKARGESSMAPSGPTPTAEVVRGEAADYGDTQEKVRSLELEIKAYLATIDELRKEVKRLTALQSGDISESTLSTREGAAQERKYDKEKIELLKKFEAEKEKLRARAERANARIRVLEAKVRTYESREKKAPDTKPAVKKTTTSKKPTSTARRTFKKRMPTPATKPARPPVQRGVTIPSL
ncbi:MAG: tetratricopeptide repeat protein [Candidatus Tritonobacter lacicola]|nr:tetratricopeptide repeat protein [Candidatus Tritonobacter lacicola]